MIIKSKSIEKFVNYSGRKLNAPQQAVIMGASAVLFQPYINRKNKRLDEDTRDMAVARSIGKCIVGNCSDFLARVVAIFSVAKLSNYITKSDKNNEDIVTVLTPKSKLDIFAPNMKDGFEPRHKNELVKDIKSYRFAMGALLATGFAVFLKTTIELPLTKKLTDYFYKREKMKKEIHDKTDRNK